MSRSVFEVFFVQWLISATLTSQLTSSYLDGYCYYPDSGHFEKVIVQQCEETSSMTWKERPPVDENCDDEDNRHKTESTTISCKSNQCILAFTIASIFSVTVVFLTLGTAVYFYRRNASDRKLLSENIYDDAVYDMSNRHTGSDVNDIELVENDLYDSGAFPVPCKQLENGDLNIYENVS